MAHRIATFILILGLFPALAFSQAEDGKELKIPADGEKTITTASGLKYSILKQAKGGKKPVLGDKVKVHYTGWLASGKLFDSSVQRGRPAEFVLGKVVPGWNEGLQLMGIGDKFKFTIPPALGYGAKGAPGAIPPNSTLIFVVELLGITAMPKFQALDPKQTRTTKSGLQYQILKQGKGDTCGKDETFEIEYALFNQEGKLLEATAQRGQKMRGTASKMHLPFLKEAPVLMNKGSIFLFAVPGKLAWGQRTPGPLVPPGSVTYWRLEMLNFVKPIPLPAFSMHNADELIKTKSGLQYKVIKAGKGPKPGPTDTVTVHYAGWLTSGVPFDSSFSRGATAKFPLNGVIPGWTEGVQLMSPGAIYKFVVPGNLAYGKQGSPPKIGPNETLVFYIILVKVGN